MKDTNEIIESGLLEQYLLGELSDERGAEVESMLNERVELRDHFNKLEEDFLQLGLENAVDPPAEVKASLLQAISETTQTHTPVIPIGKPTKRSPYLALVASLAVLFLISSIWLYNKVNTIEDQLEIVQEENSDLQTEIFDLQEDLSQTNRWYQALTDPNVQQLVIVGNAVLPEAKAISYVNHTDKTILLNTQGLPDLAEDKDYQMWADVDGEMINMGIIPRDQALVAMTYIEEAESLNITIEPAGGNDHPTVEQLIGNVYLD